MTLPRRDFLKLAAATPAALLAANAGALFAYPLGLPIGCQTWVVRHRIARDFPGTLRTLRQAGFQTIELCSPWGYAHMGFGGLQKYSGRQLRRIIGDAGLSCISSHFGLAELQHDQPARLQWAHEVGLTQMMVPSLNGPRNPSADQVKRVADQYNQIAAAAHHAGIQQGLHNEAWVDGKTSDGRRIYDLLFEYLDPTLVKFQFQVSSVMFGFDAVTYFRRYPGRFISMHLQGWSAKTKKIVPVGQGTLNWRAIFAAAKPAGVKNYFLEMNLPYMEASLPYLRRFH
ncbi:MAG: sugar phosphate isomerase/epimerase family protein [Terriglobales bacterium]